jgi:transposase
MKTNEILFPQKNPNANGGLTMKYNKEQRLEIGRRIYSGELSRYEAAEEYGISSYTARNYMRLFRDVRGLPPKRGSAKNYATLARQAVAQRNGLEQLESMNKEQLIFEIIMARIREERLKKGYEVKGDGTVIRYDTKNTK